MTNTEPPVLPLEEAKEFLKELEAILPSHVQKESYDQISKLPFKAASLHASLAHRTYNLGNSAVLLFDECQELGAIVITRSIMETVAVAHTLQRRLQKFLQVPSDRGLDEYLMKLLIANGAPDAKHPALNISGLVNSIDKRLAGFKDSYNGLSEFVHPNWSGTLGSFGELNEVEGTLVFSQKRENPSGVGLGALAGSLGSFLEIYREVNTLIAKLNQHVQEARNAA